MDNQETNKQIMVSKGFFIKFILLNIIVTILVVFLFNFLIVFFLPSNVPARLMRLEKKTEVMEASFEKLFGKIKIGN